MRILAIILCSLLCSGCSVMRALDFGGSDDRPWDFRWGWEHGIEQSKAEPGEVDEEGVYQPETPEVDAILGFPDIHAGIMVVVKPESRITPTVQVEILEFKVPYARWFSVQAGAGAQLAEFYVGKRLVSVFEVTAGPYVGWDFEEDDVAWGIGGTLIKF